MEPIDKKEVLKGVMSEAGKGAVIGGAIGGLTNAGSPVLRDAAKGVNPIRGLEVFKEFTDWGGKKALPITTGLGLGAYKGGQELVRQTQPLERIKEKIRAKKN